MDLSNDYQVTAVLFLQLIRVDREDYLREEVKKADESTALVVSRQPDLPEIPSGDDTGLYQAVGNLAERLDGIKKIVDELSKVSNIYQQSETCTGEL